MAGLCKGGNEPPGFVKAICKGDGLQIWRVAVNILNKQSWTADKGWSSSLGVGLTTHHRKKQLVTNPYNKPLIVPVFKKGDKTNCSNFRGISLLLTAYKILSNILLRTLTPYVDEIIGDHQCGFRRNRSTIDQIFCILQIMEKKWEYKGTVHQLFIDFKKVYDSVKRVVLYDILEQLDNTHGRPISIVDSTRWPLVTGPYRAVSNKI
ncbi:hypothetical protein ANN_25684 [Periplaneta americana]|uniref:Reverse transcriptase domain-containing protein n=1 Tax=Periplaneta americana TaxID=6978 RepID=A0ABQ8S490_PERAM|nr:hypothetical protein ANN_25684 [Periplaneta americana]